MVILDPNGMSFDAVCAFGPDFQLLFKSSSSYCVLIKATFIQKVEANAMQAIYQQRKMTEHRQPVPTHQSKQWKATECHSSITISLVVTRKTTRNYYAHSKLSPGNVKICDSARMTSP